MGDYIELYTIPDLLVRAADCDPDGDCVVFPDEHISYRLQLDRATSVARSLAAMGVGKGDHVAMVLPNMAEYVDVLLGTMLLGAWAVPINSRYKARELGYVIENADAKVLITTDAIDEFVDYVALLNESFPDLATQANPNALSLANAPRLQAVVVIGNKWWARSVGTTSNRSRPKCRSTRSTRCVAVSLFATLGS
jgi:acyl-CoA synthetase (AMP-forming)/AMP-acid ligase II